MTFAVTSGWRPSPPQPSLRNRPGSWCLWPYLRSSARLRLDRGRIPRPISRRKVSAATKAVRLLPSTNARGLGLSYASAAASCAVRGRLVDQQLQRPRAAALKQVAVAQTGHAALAGDREWRRQRQARSCLMRQIAWSARCGRVSPGSLKLAAKDQRRACICA